MNMVKGVYECLLCGKSFEDYWNKFPTVKYNDELFGYPLCSKCSKVNKFFDVDKLVSSGKEREYRELKKQGLWLLVGMLKLKRKCVCCGVGITEENIGGVGNKPDRVFCDSILCGGEKGGDCKR